MRVLADQTKGAQSSLDQLNSLYAAHTHIYSTPSCGIEQGKFFGQILELAVAYSLNPDGNDASSPTSTPNGGGDSLNINPVSAPVATANLSAQQLMLRDLVAQIQTITGETKLLDQRIRGHTHNYMLAGLKPMGGMWRTRLCTEETTTFLGMQVGSEDNVCSDLSDPTHNPLVLSTGPDQPRETSGPHFAA